MNWNELITECWELLKNELKNQKIDKIELFMNYVFHDIFTVLNESREITTYNRLLSIEEKLDKIISDKIKLFIQETGRMENIEKKEKINPILSNSLNFNKEEDQFYNLFLYSDYIDENYIINNLKHKDENKYPVLRKFLLSNNKSISKQNKRMLHLDYLQIFNSSLNLIKNKYIFNITRQEAENTILKDEEIYKINRDTLDEFIELCNFLKKIIIMIYLN